MIRTDFILTKTNPVKNLVRVLSTLCLALLLLSGVQARNYIWTGAGADNLWSNPDNWVFGDGTAVLASDLPMDPGDNAEISGGTGKPQLTQNETIGNLLISARGLDLNGYVLNAASLTIPPLFVSESIENGAFVISGSANITSAIFTDVDISAGTWVDLNGAIFLNATTITKTGGSNDGVAIYGNTFTGGFTFRQTFAGAGGNIRFGNATYNNNYQGDATFENNGGSLIAISENNASFFAGDLTINNASTGGIELGNGAGGSITVLGDFSLSSTAAGPIQIENIQESGTGGGVAITAGAAIAIRSCTLNDPVSITNSTSLAISDCIFEENVSASVSGSISQISNSEFRNTAPHTFTGGDIEEVGGCQFAGNVTFNNGMADNCPWDGGNTFSGDATFNKTAATIRNWRLDVNTANTFAGNVVLDNNAGTGLFNFSENGFNLSNATLTLINTSMTTKNASGPIVLTDVPTISGSGEWSATTLTISNASGSIDIGPSLLITGGGSGLTLTNTIANMTSGGTVTLNDPTPFTGGGATAFINGGALQKLGNTATDSGTPFTFHVGDQGIYAPFSYTTSNSGSQPQVTVRYFHVPPSGSNPYAPNGTLSQEERWEMSVLVTSLGNTLVTLPYGPQSGVIGDEADLRVAFAAPGSSAFTDLEGAASGGFIEADIAQTYTAGAGIYTFTLGSINAVQTPLPVELLYFQATAEGEQVRLQWATASETNNDHFQVERSANGTDFERVGDQVRGAGNTDEPLNYELVDADPLPGVSYYRLKQVDFDGRYEYSNIEVVQMGDVATGALQLFPNPVRDQLQVRWDGDRNIDRLRLLTARGQEVSIDARINDKQAEVDLGDLPAGVYFLEVLSGRERRVQKVVK